MKTIKVIGLALATMLFAVLAFGTANAAEYTVKKGDTLWGIAYKTWGTGKLYKAIASENKIKNPNKIFPNQKLTIPAVGKITVNNFNTAPYGARAEKNNSRVIKGIENTFFSPEYKKCMADVVMSSNPGYYKIEKGETVDCISDNKGVYCNPEGYAYGYSAMAHIWRAECEKEYRKILCDIILVDKCGNFTPRCREETIVPPVTEKIPEKEIEIVPPEEEVAPPEEEVTITLFEEPKEEKVEERCDLTEFTPGIGYVKSFKSHTDDIFGFVDHVEWMQKNCSLPNNYGVGFYGIGDAGHGRNDVSWSKIAPGAQFALWKQLDKQDALLAKFRLNYAIKNTHWGGKDQPTKYYLMPGIYSEIVRSFSATDKVILALDANYLPDDSYGSLKLYWEHRVSQDWKLKPGAGPIYIESAGDAFGANLSFTARYRNRLNLVPSITLIKGGPSYGGLVYYEFGPDIRMWYLNHERDKVKKINKEGGEKEVILQPEEGSSVNIEGEIELKESPVNIPTI